jgi:hypothetical protein
MRQRTLQQRAIGEPILNESFELVEQTLKGAIAAAVAATSPSLDDCMLFMTLMTSLLTHCYSCTEPHHEESQLLRQELAFTGKSRKRRKD